MRGAREAPGPRGSLNFRRASLLSRNEFESGTFTIVLHATSSFTYVSVIYGANFPFKEEEKKKIFGMVVCGNSNKICTMAWVLKHESQCGFISLYLFNGSKSCPASFFRKCSGTQVASLYPIHFTRYWSFPRRRRWDKIFSTM